MKLQKKKDRKVSYPKVGDTVQLTIGRQGEVEYIGIYEVVDGDGMNNMTLEFYDLRVVKESDIPI